jgi:hypothetical protein
MMPQEEQQFLIEKDGLGSRRVWLIPVLLFLILLAPLLRDGIPATQAGALLLHASMAEEVVHPFLIGLSGLHFGYKPVVYLFVGLVLICLVNATKRLWNKQVAWWVASLWLMSPLTISLIYQRGWIFYMMDIALEPYQLFSSAWPNPMNVREWVGGPSSQLGFVPVVLALLAAMTAWPRREEVAAQKVLILLGIATISALLTLLGGPILLYLLIATLALILAAGGLPLLDKRYASLPVLLGLLAVAALSVYPYLEVAWMVPDELPAQPLEVLFGEKEVWLLDIESQQEGEIVTIEVLWQVTAPPKRDYTAFVHLLNEEGEILAQADTLLIDQDEITSSNWPVGYLVRQQYQAITQQAPVEIRLGLYDLESLERLPLINGGDSVTVPVTAD